MKFGQTTNQLTQKEKIPIKVKLLEEKNHNN
jgi:hypothetical protein